MFAKRATASTSTTLPSEQQLAPPSATGIGRPLSPSVSPEIGRVVGVLIDRAEEVSREQKRCREEDTNAGVRSGRDRRDR